MNEERDPRRRVAVDATWRSEDGLTAIAAVQDDRNARPLASEILYTTGPDEAELAAIFLALHVGLKAGFPRMIVNSDSQNAVRALNGSAGPRKLRAEVARGRSILRERAWLVRHVERQWNAAAHAMASQAMKAWLAGCRGETTVDGLASLATEDG